MKKLLWMLFLTGCAGDGDERTWDSRRNDGGGLQYRPTTSHAVAKGEEAKSVAVAQRTDGPDAGLKDVESADAANNGEAPVRQDAGEVSDEVSQDSGGRDEGREPQTADAGIPEMPQPEPVEPAGPNVLATPELGVLVIGPEDSQATVTQPPEWSREASAAGQFDLPDGECYAVLVYEKTAGEMIDHWQAHSEVGDAYVSDDRIFLPLGGVGYVYTTNDHGASPDVHVAVNTARFVYHFQVESEEAMARPEFREFIEELEVQ